MSGTRTADGAAEESRRQSTCQREHHCLEQSTRFLDRDIPQETRVHVPGIVDQRVEITTLERTCSGIGIGQVGAGNLNLLPTSTARSVMAAKGP
jgi:hypothetical protein